MLLGQARLLIGYQINIWSVNHNTPVQLPGLISIFINNCLAYFLGLALVIIDLKFFFKIYIFINIIIISFTYSFFIIDLTTIVKFQFHFWNFSFWFIEFTAYLHALNWRRENFCRNSAFSLTLLFIAAIVESKLRVTPW